MKIDFANPTSVVGEIKALAKGLGVGGGTWDKNPRKDFALSEGRRLPPGALEDSAVRRGTPCAEPLGLSPTFGRLPCCQSRPVAPPDDVPEFFAQKTGGGREEGFNGACR